MSDELLMVEASVTLSPEAVRELLGQERVRIIDARRRDEYEQGHLPGAFNLPLEEVIRAEGERELVKAFEERGIDGDSLVIIYDDAHGAFAARVAWGLEFLGHPRVRLLDGTFSTWRSLGYEVSLEEPNRKKGSLEPRVRPELLATAEYIKALIELDGSSGEGGLRSWILDVRERLNYLEGHIPGAKTMPWRMLAGSRGLFREPSKIKRFLEARGIGEGDELITYCGGAGTLSGLAFYALRSAGLKRVRLYAKSFLEWRSLELPIERVRDANYWDLSAE